MKTEPKLNQSPMYKRKKRKWAPLASTLLWLTLVKLFCDRSLPMAAAEQAESPTDNNNNNQNARQRFLEEPRNTSVLLGAPAQLTCLVENRRGTVVWRRQNYLVGYGSIESSFVPRYSLASDGSPVDTDAPTSHNYSLLIKSVLLSDDADFECSVRGPKNSIKSRLARLTVLKPPTQLAISLTSIEPSESSSSQWTDIGPQNHATPPDSSPGQPANNSPTHIVQRIVVRQNSRLRLECRSDSAKPQAQLVWLDHRQRKVPKRQQALDTSRAPNSESATLAPDESANSLLDANNSTEYADELVSADDKEPKLATTTLVWSFLVQRHHADQVLTCQAQHPAFEEHQLFPQLYGREPRQQVRLEVQYLPEISLTKSQPQPRENEPIRFTCSAQAWPNELTYSWFIDDQLVADANEPELFVARLSRQLHNRDIVCRVANELGNNSARLRLYVRYAPLYVTHLLPASLQPAPLFEPAELYRAGVAPRWSGPRAESALALGRQLALGYKSDLDIQLRCDFDSSPQVKHVVWYKIKTNFTIKKDVTPKEADELINYGETHAIFQRAHPPPPPPLVTSRPEHDIRNRRHIINQLDTSADFSSYTSSELETLDFEHMSVELLDELKLYEQRDKQLAKSAITEPELEEIASPPAIQITPLIFEPLSWFWSQVPSGRNQLEEPGEQERALILVQPSNLTHPHQARMTRREALVSSSTISLRANSETAGKYICKVKSPDGHESARSIYLVERRRPRCVSVQRQFGALGARQLQVECLIQINTVIDNSTAVTWYKEGKVIDVMQRETSSGSSGKSYSIKEEYSADLLYMRSTLIIDNADLSDFGLYNCTVINSIADDHIAIRLEFTILTGFVFTVMASLAFGSVILLVSVIALLIVFTPSRKLDAKISDELVHIPDAVQSERKAPSDTASDPTNDHHQQDKEISQVVDSTLNQFVPKSVTSSMMMSDQFQHQPNASNGPQNQHPHRIIRQPMVAPNRSNKFAAIHECLEQQLQLGQPPQLGPRVTSGESDLQQPNQLQDAQTPSEFDRTSILNRLWTRFRPSEAPRNGAHRAKPRPTISLPVGSSNHRASFKRSSLSTSLSILGSSDASLASGNNSAKLSHINGGSHLVSSSANLIQDSTTASDGTVNSSRSSSSSGQNQELNIPNPKVNLIYPNSTYMQQQQQQQQQQQHYQTVPPPLDLTQRLPGQRLSSLNLLDSSVFVEDANSYLPENGINQVYNNTNLPYTVLDQSVQMTNGFTNQPNEWIDHNQSASIGHYQLPVLVGDAYFSGQQQQQPQTTRYATLCTESIPTFAPCNDNNIIKYNNNTSTNYGTLPMRPPSNQCQMVPTSDAGDAFFESNYGKLLSRSSAYKTLGYATSPAASNANSALSSPNNSLASYNVANQNHNSEPLPPQVHTSNELQFEDVNQSATVVHSDGTTKAIKSLGDDGLATHV